MRAKAAFTLFEMAVVLAIIALLAGGGFALVFKNRERLIRNRAEADLIVIQQGLEAYRARFGDYPRYPVTIPPSVVDEEGYLLNALCGKFDPNGKLIDIPPMLNLALLQFQNPGLPYAGVLDNRIVDPWNNPYVYDDKPVDGSAKLMFGYGLYSKGPDGNIGGGDDVFAK